MADCIFCPHSFHKYACYQIECLCDNQSRTETLQDRRDRRFTAIQQPDNVDITIGCCLCFCLTGIKQAATQQIDGYWVCDEHAQWMAQPFTDFADLLRRVKHNTTRNAT